MDIDHNARRYAGLHPPKFPEAVMRAYLEGLVMRRMRVDPPPKRFFKARTVGSGAAASSRTRPSR